MAKRTWAANRTHALIAGVIAGTAACGANAQVDAGATQLDRVEVRGGQVQKKTDLINDATALPGSTTRVTQSDIAKESVSSYGDLLRPVTGLNINSFGIGGLGYGFSLRGFVDTEHGKDIAVFVDGTPANVSSAVQANGYIDLNPLIPETIRSFDVIRGPVSALYGNHAFGGSIVFRTLNEMPGIRLDLSGGSWGTVRALGIVGLRKDRFDGYTAFEGYDTRGYRDNNRDRRFNSFTKVSIPLASGVASLRVQLYEDSYGEPGYINRAAVESGAISGRATINPTDKGLNQQQNVVFNYDGTGRNYWTTSAYVFHKELFRTRTTGGNSLPGLGTLQRVGLDRRYSFGGSVQRTTSIDGLGVPLLLVAGASLHADVVHATRFDANLRGDRTTQNQDRDLDLYNPAAYVELQAKPIDPLKLTVGARYDKFYNAIETGPTDGVPNVDESPKPGRFSPKVGAAWTIVEGLDLYGNVSRGLKAPSAYDELITSPSLDVSRIRSTEVGISATGRDGAWHLGGALWRTDQTGEVQTDPVTGDLINFGKTRRQGYDLEAKVRAFRTATAEASVFANYSYVSARIVGGGPADRYVTTVPQYTATIGVDVSYTLETATATHRVGAFVYDSYVGKKHLDAAGAFDSRAYQRISAKLTYANSAWKGITPYLSATVYPTSRLDETTFFSGGVVVTAPKAPVTALAGVTITLD